MVTGLRSTMEEHEERYAHRNEMKIKIQNDMLDKVRLSGSALPQFRVSIKAPAQVVHPFD